MGAFAFDGSAVVAGDDVHGPMRPGLRGHDGLLWCGLAPLVGAGLRDRDFRLVRFAYLDEASPGRGAAEVGPNRGVRIAPARSGRTHSHVSARRRPPRGGIGSNQYKTRGKPINESRARARAATFAATGPAVVTIDTLAQAAIDRYRELVASEGGDPEVELATVRLAGECTISEWVGWRLVCHRYGQNPDEPGSVRYLDDRMITVMVEHEDPFDDVALTALRLTGLDENERAAHALDEDADPELLKALATDGSALVRSWVARNGRSPEDVLGALATDPHPTVRRRLLGNPATPSDALDQLAGDPAMGTWLPKLIEHPNTPDATLRRLARHRSPWVRESADAKLTDRARRPHP